MVMHSCDWRSTTSTPASRSQATPPAKLTDSRAEGYVAKFGLSSWELDALDPTTLAGLIETAVVGFRDPALWAEAVEEEEEGLRLLQEAAGRWGDVASFLQSES